MIELVGVADVELAHVMEEIGVEVVEEGREAELVFDCRDLLHVFVQIRENLEEGLHLGERVELVGLLEREELACVSWVELTRLFHEDTRLR